MIYSYLVVLAGCSLDITKSLLLLKLLKNIFCFKAIVIHLHKIIIGIDFKIKRTNIDGKVVKLQIWLVNTFLINFPYDFLQNECICINCKHQCTTDYNYNKNNKNIFKNERVCRNIYQNQKSTGTRWLW